MNRRLMDREKLVRLEGKYAFLRFGLLRALTLVEMVLAMAIMVIVFAALLPQFRAILNSWDSKAAAAETLQNARVLIDHFNHNLTEAARITAVSDFTETVGFIEFEDNDGESLRYDVDANNYVQFGLIGSLSELAGPVSQFQFTCYDGNDFVSPTTDVNDIRFVKAEATLTNPAAMGRDMTFTAKTYIRTNTVPCTQGLIGWWKLDETSGLIAADSSGNGNDGTLTNMAGDEWTAGPVDGALEFDGGNDYVLLPYILNPDDGDFTAAAWVYLDNENPDDPADAVLSQEDNNGTGRIWLARRKSDDVLMTRFGGSTLATSTTLNLDTWYHIAVVYDKGASATNEGVAKLYINGQKKASGDVDQDSCTGSMHIGVGKGNKREWDGIIDDVRIYDRALGPEQIVDLADVLVYREFTEAKAGSDTTSITVSTPSGTSEGDLLIAAVATDGDTASSLAAPGGEGWSEVDVDDYSGEVTFGAWWKLADASESPSHQFTWSGPEHAYGWMMRFTGHDPTDPIDDWRDDRETSSTPISPAVNTTVDDCLILRLGGFDDSNITVDDPGLSGHTAITMDSSWLVGGLVGWWKLDKSSGLTATDSSGNGNDGTLTNMSGNEWTTGQVDGGLEFDGNNDAITGIGNCPTGNFTVAAWAKDTGGSGWKVLYSAEQEIWFGVDSGASPSLWCDCGGNGNGANTAAGTWTQDVWRHAAVTWDGTTIHLYLDGDDMEITTYGTPENPLAKAAVIGAWSDNPSDENWFGTLDDVRLYNRALSGDEITALAEGSGGGGGDPVSGGAGYVKQSAAGDSGTSDFSLTASEQSRTITIAIAPSPEGGEGCGDAIGP